MKKKIYYSGTNNIKLLSLSWRDKWHHYSGGAEVHTHEMLKGAVEAGMEVVHISTKHKEGAVEEQIDGVHYIRKGNNITVIFFAWIFYLKNRKKITFVIDQCNTHRFYTKFWVSKKKRIFYIHQFTKEIWELIFPGIIGIVGRILEHISMYFNKEDYTITVSESTKRELMAYGYNADKIMIIHNGVSFPIPELPEIDSKAEGPVFIYTGRYVAYKGIDDAIEAFGIFKKKYQNAKLWLVGRVGWEYVEKKLKPILDQYSLSYGTEESNDVVIWGFVSEEQKLSLQKQAHALLFPSAREGWGIIVIEAALMGTPSIVYNSPGCRDAVNYGEAGYLCDLKNIIMLEEQMERSWVNNEEYMAVRRRAYDFSKQFQWEISRKEFVEFIEKINREENK